MKHDPASANRIAVLAWALLMLASLGTWWVAENHSLDARASLVIIVVVAAIKARAIVLHYMELKHAPLAWRLAFEGWILVAALILLLGWFLS